MDSKNFHVNLFQCNNMTLRQFHIIAPDESPNTDGIHLGESTGIRIMKSNIATGDDCISMGPGSRNIRIKEVTCGPGHGISVGSLGGHQGEEPIVGVMVQNSTFTRTMNGVRVKVWPKANTGTVTDLHFEDLIMNGVEFPVIIDQAYCPHNMCDSSEVVCLYCIFKFRDFLLSKQLKDFYGFDSVVYFVISNHLLRLVK